MAAQKGSLMLIKVGDGAEVENYSTLGGLRLSRMILNQAVMDASCIGSGQWQQLISGAGLRSISLDGDGIFMDSAAEERARGYAFSGSAQHFRMYFGNGDYFQGSFIIRSYSRSGSYLTEEVYSLHMESAGNVAFVAA